MNQPAPAPAVPPPAVAPPDSVRSDVPPLWRQVLEGVAILAVAWALSRWGGFRPPGLDLIAFAAILVAARVGFWPGALVGAAGTLMMLAEAGNRPADFLMLDVDRQALPAALAPIGFAAVVGWIADSHRAKATRLEEERAALAAKYALLEDQHGVVVKAKEALDRRIVGQVETITAIYEAAQELEALEPAAVWAATARLAARFLEAEAVAVYVVDGFRLRLVAAHGERPDRPGLLSVQDGLVGAVARSGRAAGVRAKEEYLAGGVLLAAAMRGAGPQARGVIAIERMAFSRLTPATRQLLELIADWSGRALAASEAAERQQAEQAIDPTTGLMRAAMIVERLRQEWSVARRYKLPLSAMIVRRPALLELPAGRRSAEAVPLVLGLRKLTRDVDLLGYYRTDDSFLVVLPQTGKAGAEILATRIQAAIDGVIVVSASNDDGPTSAEVMLQMLQLLAFDMQEA